MSLRMTVSTARRILMQLRHDRRTVALLVLVPTLLLVLLHYVFGKEARTFDRVGLIMLGVFPFLSMFLVTSVSMLRERTSGTLERLLTTPIHKLDLLTGYGLAFGVTAAIQGSVAAVVAYRFLGLSTEGSPVLVGGIVIADGILGMAVGILVSAFASSEFQAVQFMPAIVMPQALLCGLIVPRSEMSGWLQAISNGLPLTYAVDALTQIGAHESPTPTMWRDFAVILGAAATALVLGAMTLRRRSG